MKMYVAKSDKSYHKVLREVIQIILDGGIVIYPTDTVYGIGCSAKNKDAVSKLVQLKRRQEKKPFSFICKDIATISQFAVIPNWAYRLMSKALPGPYTFVLEARKTNLPKELIGKRNTVGVRIPSNYLCNKMADLIDLPIVSTSVNVAGEESISRVDKLPTEFLNQVDAVIDAGPATSGPSTIVDATGKEPVVIREGFGKLFWL
ncbi:MAG: L-threonylcarbamoyladenylate synthase [Nitrospinota bacterium]